jgi:large subunit ribosomal protein L25
MEKVKIEATRRTVTGKQVGNLRREGKLPGVMYGHNFETTPIVMDFRTASRILHGVSKSTIVNIVLDGKEIGTLVRERQKDYLRNEFLHVDFQVVSLTEKIRTKVGIELVGLSPAVKDFNGVVVHELDEVDVEGFPQDLPEKLVVDVSGLTNIGQSILLNTLDISDKLTVFTDLDSVVVVITGGAAEIVEEVVEAVEEPEVIERGKKEEEVEE